MIFTEPKLEARDKKVLDVLRGQRDRLRVATQSNPRRWHGSLRKNTFARAIQGSNSIEGYNASIDEAMAAVEEEPIIDEVTETWNAINGYRTALAYIMQAAQDPYFEFSKQFLKSLHFMMVGFDMEAYPGQWRPGEIYVVNNASGVAVYTAPDNELVDPLVQELVKYLEDGKRESTVTAAALAHLNLTMIHPFKDGNGRIARALQTLILAREGMIHPMFSSIEEWLGRNTEDYYKVLAEVGEGKWSPQNDALPWLRFCFTAHYQQANTLIRRIEEYETVFEQIATIVQREKLNERTAMPLFDAALGMRLTNFRYQRETEESSYVAGRDLKTLTEIGIIEPHGEKRGRYYTAGPELKNAREKARRKKVISNPYALPEVEPSPRLPGI